MVRQLTDKLAATTSSGEVDSPLQHQVQGRRRIPIHRDAPLQGWQSSAGAPPGGFLGCVCRLLRRALTVSHHQAHVRDHGRHHHLQAGLRSPKVSTLANSQLRQPRDAMLHPHPFSQALAPGLGLVVRPGLLLQGPFGVNANCPKSFLPARYAGSDARRVTQGNGSGVPHPD